MTILSKIGGNLFFLAPIVMGIALIVHGYIADLYNVTFVGVVFLLVGAMTMLFFALEKLVTTTNEELEELLKERLSYLDDIHVQHEQEIDKLEQEKL